MSILPKNLIRYGLVLLGTAVAVGCSSDGDDGTSGTISLALNPTSATVLQGGSSTVTATLTRGGGFTGTVNLTVTGAPTGVTATVSNVQTTGAVTTATVTIQVGATVAAAVYPLVVHGTGTGVTEATANFSLTVTALPAADYTMTLSSPTVSIVQGAATPTINVTLVRTNFTGNVTFSVENLPTGVTAAFVPNATGTSASVLTLTVASTAVVATTNLTVRGAATGLTDRTAPLALTVTAAAPAGSFALSVIPAGGVSLVQGTSNATKTIVITRTNYTAAVTLTAEGLPTGVTASFSGNPCTCDQSLMTLTATAGATVGGPVTITIRGTGPDALRLPGDEASIKEATTTLALTVTASAPVGNFTLTTTPATTANVTQGGNTNVTVNINRTGGFAGSVDLTVTGLVTGLTAGFTPTPAPGATSTLNIAAAGTLVAGNYPIVIRGNFTGLAEQTVNLTVVVAAAGNFTLTTTPPTSVPVTQGASVNVTVNINRTGGLTSSVALTSTTTLPTGMTLAFLPTSTTGASSVLTITTTGATPVGGTLITIRGNATGLTEQTVTITVNVTAPGGSGNVTVSFVGCDPEDKAVWFAFMDGTAGTWTAVPGAADVYNFNITQSKGSFAYVLLNVGGAGSSTIVVQHFTQAELTGAVLNFCGTVVTPNTRVANGTVSNIPAGFLATISFGGGATAAFADGPFSITNAMTGTFDLIGYAHPPSGIAITDRVFVKRGENPAAGGSFSVPVNFTDPTLSFGPAIGAATLSGLTGSETLVSHGMNFFTGGTACVPASLYGTGATAASFNMYGVPAPPRLGTDMHGITITAGGTTAFRFLIENFLDVVARAATPFVLPALHPTPVVTDAGGPYKRLSIAVNPVPAELNGSHSITYTDQTVTTKSGFVSASQGWVGGTNLLLVVPNFAGVGTFSNAWAPATSDVLNWSIGSSGGTLTGGCTAGSRFVTSSRSGTL